MNGFERFSSHDFLLERGKATYRYLGQEWRKDIFSFVIRSLLFGGFLGILWVITHLHPQGDLSLYLMPFILFAMPVAMIAPKEHTWQRIINYGFVATYWLMIVWSSVWYFKYDYLFKWLFISTLLTLILSWISSIKFQKKATGPQQSLLLFLWLFGLLICMGFLGLLSYYLISQTIPKLDTTNLLAGGCFVFFTAMMLTRIFWLNSIKNRRATRSEHTPPQDFVLFFEWLIPSSYSFILVLISVLISEAMLFSTINYSSIIKEEGRIREEIEKQESNKTIYNNSSYPIKKKHRFLAQDFIFSHDQYDESTDLSQIIPKNHLHELKLYLPKLEHPILYEKNKKLEITPIQRLELFEQWLFFSFKPYVFPKNADGLELKTPDWFRLLGRTLLGLIFAILLTQQFNTWFRLGSLYLTLVGAKKRKILRGETDDLNRQETEMLLLLQSTFNHLSSFWRWIFFKAVINIKLNLRWKLVFDPGMVFFDIVDRIQLWLMSRWYMALLSVTFVISIVTLPFYYFEPDINTQMIILDAFQNAIQPILICTILILILRFAFQLLPPKSYQFWIWWVLLSHMIFAILVFFLDISINTGDQDLFWAKVLWYLQLCSVGVFPALYLFGGERYRHVTIFGMRTEVDSNDCDIQANLSILRSLFGTDHRQWLLQKIISYVHPIRSGTIQFKLILPSLLQGLIDIIKYLLTKLSALFKSLANDYGKSSIIWIGFVGGICTIAMLWHMFRYHKFLTPLIISIYLLNFFCLALPTFLTTAFLSIKKLGKGNEWHRPNHPLYLLIWLFLISCLSTYIWWYYFHQTNALVTPEIFEEMFIYTRFTYVFIIPLLPLWVLYQQYKDNKHQQTEDQSQSINLLDRFTTWLAKKEQNFLNSIYQKTMKNKDLDSRIRIELIQAAYILLESTYRSVASGKWDEEEEHAIRRVYLQWVGAYQKAEEMVQLGVELTDLQEQLVDTLASLLHDLITQRLELDEQENIVIVLIDTLTKIVLLPNPSKLLHQDTELKGRIDHCYSSLGNMIAWMLKDLNNDVVRSQRFKLLKLLSALKESSFEHLAQELLDQENNDQSKQELKQELISASILQNNSLSFLLGLFNNEQEDPEIKKQAKIAYLIKTLPTPLAQSLYQLSTLTDQLNHIEYKADHHKNQNQAFYQQFDHQMTKAGTAQYLNEIQNPIFLQQRVLFLTSQEDFKHIKSKAYQQLYACYTQGFAYLLALIKDLEFAQDINVYHKELQCLPWHCADEMIYSFYQLRRIQLKNTLAIDIRTLIFELYTISHIKFMEKLQVNQKELSKGLDLLIDILGKISEKKSILPILYYHPTKNLHLIQDQNFQLQTQIDLDVFIFEGLKVKTIALKDFNEKYAHQQRSLLSFGRGIWMKEFDIRPIIDYYPALWCLKQIHILSYSDGLFHPEQKEKIKAGLDLLLEIASRFASLLRPFPPEEQRIIAEIYHQISDRLYLLKDLSVDELNRIEGQGNIDFEEGLIRLVKYLDGLRERVEKRFEHLLALEMLPSQNFIYLEGAEKQDLGELRWYEDFDQQKAFIYLHQSKIIS